MRKIAACDDSCPERSYLQPCKEISSGHRNAYSTLASYSSKCAAVDDLPEKRSDQTHVELRPIIIPYMGTARSISWTDFKFVYNY